LLSPKQERPSTCATEIVVKSSLLHRKWRHTTATVSRDGERRPKLPSPKQERPSTCATEIVVKSSLLHRKWRHTTATVSREGERSRESEKGENEQSRERVRERAISRRRGEEKAEGKTEETEISFHFVSQPKNSTQNFPNLTFDKHLKAKNQKPPFSCNFFAIPIAPWTQRSGRA
jgi:hypothetical protein